MNAKIEGWIKRLKPLYHALLGLRSAVLGTYMRLCHRLCGVDGNKVAFSSFKGAGCNDSPRAIAEALRELRPDVDVVFQLKDGAERPAWARTAKPRSLRWLKELSTAKVTVDNFNRPYYQMTFPDQRYVQTWHGDRGFKRVLFDAFPDEGYPDNRYMSLAVAGSDFCERMYRTAFRYDGEVLKTGLPRNDCLLHPMDKAEACRKCDLPQDKKIALYAPTFRDADAGSAFRAEFDPAKAVEALKQATGEDWVFVSRAHDQNTSVAGAMLDRTDYPEMADLMQAADLLITDYSSCAGDFPLLQRPVILYHSRAAYDRELYFDIEKSPFRIAHNEQELYALFRDLDGAAENDRAILDFFGTHETGRSARDVAERICQWLDE